MYKRKRKTDRNRIGKYCELLYSYTYYDVTIVLKPNLKSSGKSNIYLGIKKFAVRYKYYR